METKLCRKCNTVKNIDKFGKNKTTKDGLQSWCCECKNEYNKNYKRENKQKLKKYYKTKDRERYLKNKEKILQQHKEYDKKHKEEKRKLRREYYYKNKEKLKKYNYEYLKRKIKEDPIFKMNIQIRNMIRFSFFRKGYLKSQKTEQIVGIELKELYKYLLKTFENNYGYKWDGVEKVHIDHIIPLSTANTEEEVIKLCYYTNLQLLKAKDNLEKSYKLNWELK
jgi:hypothetical protein